MNAVSLIRSFFPPRKEAAPRDPVRKLAERFDLDARFPRLSKGDEKRLVRLFNAAQAHICLHPDFEERRSELEARLHHVHDLIVPNLKPSKCSEKIGQLSGSMLEVVKNLQPQPERQAAVTAYVLKSPDADTRPYKLLHAPYRSHDICPADNSIRVIDTRTMSLRDAFAVKLKNASVSVETMNKLDAIFTREYRILLAPLGNNGYPEIRKDMFLDASLPGFRSLPVAASELEDIASMVSQMKDSHAATVLSGSISIYKAHIEAATRWWTEAATRGLLLRQLAAPENKPAMDLARCAPIWLDVTPSTLRWEISQRQDAAVIQTPPRQNTAPRQDASNPSPNLTDNQSSPASQPLAHWSD